MREKYKRQEESTHNFWQSYSDIMASILLVVVLVLSVTILNAQKNYEEKKRMLDLQTEEISRLRNDVEDQEKKLDLEQSKMEEQARIIDEQKQQLEQILGIKKSIIDALTKKFNKDGELTVNPQTGAIMFKSDLLFDTDRWELKAEGKKFLDAFIPKYISTLMSSDFSPYISEIIVEGHADTNGGYIYNLDLSQKRALSVVTYFLSDNNKIFTSSEIQKLRKVVTANGRSWSNPIYTQTGQIDLDSSRRVEIQFRLKEQDMIDAMISALK